MTAVLPGVPSVRLECAHPLHTYLAKVVLPRCGVEVGDPEFEGACLGRGAGVYWYRERRSQAAFICKFFGHRRGLSPARRGSLLRLEFANLEAARAAGLADWPHRVVRPLGASEGVSFLLVEDYARGRDLDHYIAGAAWAGQHRRLFARLSALAHFLAELHGRTVQHEAVDMGAPCQYFRKIVATLARQRVASPRTVRYLHDLCRAWEASAEMRRDHAVLIHGDATPTNFLFHPEDGVTAIDLERMRAADRVYDLGMVAAELRHHFAWRCLDANAAEPFIGHFLWAYCERLPEPMAAFQAITHRNRFYMALAELRIARNDWLPWEHRRWLVHEACRCAR